MPEISLVEKKLLKAWGTGCTRMGLISLGVIFLMFGAFLGLAILVFLLPIPNEQRIYILVGGFFLILFLMIAFAFVWGAWSIHRNSRKLDAALSPLDLTGKAYMWNGRQYHGLMHGRQVDVYFYRGPSMDIYIASPLSTRLGIGLKGRKNQPFSVGMNQTELVINNPAMQDVGVYSMDERWGRELLDDPFARAIILRLAAIQTGLEFRNLLFQPEALHFQLHHINPGTLTPENVHNWVADLLDLVRIAESLPPPGVTDAASSLEHKARLSRSDFTLPLLGISCGIILLFTAILAVGLFLVLFFAQGSF
jgi:hypothetical protein